MTDERAKTIERYVDAVVAAVTQAAHFDATKCAASLVAAAVMLVGEDRTARLALSRLMLKLGTQLDRDDAGTTMLQ